MKRKEIFSIFQKELNRFLSAIDIPRLAKDVIDGTSVEVDTKITFRTKDETATFPVKVDRLKVSRPDTKTKSE